MAPRKKLTLADLGAATAARDAAPPEPKPVPPSEVEPPAVHTPPPPELPARPAGSVNRPVGCAAPRAHDGCLFGGDPFPTCFAPGRVFGQCPNRGRG